MTFPLESKQTQKLPKARSSATPACLQNHRHSPNTIHVGVVVLLLSPFYVILVSLHWGGTWCYVGHVFGGAVNRFSRPLAGSLGRGRDTTAGVDPLTARAYNRSSSGTKDVARREFVSISGGWRRRRRWRRRPRPEKG